MALLISIDNESSSLGVNVFFWDDDDDDFPGIIIFIIVLIVLMLLSDEGNDHNERYIISSVITIKIKPIPR